MNAISAVGLRKRYTRNVGRTEGTWVLDGLSFDVKQGEIFGLIGANGSGKSTVLKIVSEIIAPSSGHMDISGTVTPLLEVGAGFHPEMTAIENIYLNAAIFGIAPKETRKRIDAIIDYAGISNPTQWVKYFSTGMLLRLAFAIAVFTDPQILIVDETLGGGDEEFQQKSLLKMLELAKIGTTILVVSHHKQTIAAICDRVLWLESGRAKEIGDAATVVENYRDSWNAARGAA